MEQHGINPEQNVVAVIPARYASTRLPGKLLLEIGGIPLVVHTLNQVRKALSVTRIVVAADDERIASAVRFHGGEAIMTAKTHQSGSDRIAEVAEKHLAAGSIVVNVQGDEPLIPPSTIDAAVAAVLSDTTVDIATTSEPINEIEDVLSPHVVKVVVDRNGNALYFSRSPIPFPRDSVDHFGSLELALESDSTLLRVFRKHTGLYAYRREYLLEFSRMERSALERLEMLEQLRALENGARIRIVEVSESSIGVDTAADLERVRALIEGARR